MNMEVDITYLNVWQWMVIYIMCWKFYNPGAENYNINWDCLCLETN